VILVDTNIFVDIWTVDPKWGEWSAEALARAAEKGAVGVNPIIYAELCIGFQREADLEAALSQAGILRWPLPYAAAWRAAQAFLAYRKRGGQRTVPLPDFFIGAHAQAVRLAVLTRDPARYRTYFPAVKLISPAL
jgi:hypothetical protein